MKRWNGIYRNGAYTYCEHVGGLSVTIRRISVADLGIGAKGVPCLKTPRDYRIKLRVLVLLTSLQ